MEAITEMISKVEVSSLYMEIFNLKENSNKNLKTKPLKFHWGLLGNKI